MAILKQVSGFVVFNNDGSLNVEDTVENIRKAVMLEIEQTAIRDIEIEAALDNVYTRLGTDVYPTPEVISIAAAGMVGNDLSQMAVVSEQIREYLTRSTRFVGVRGRKGGLRKVK